MRQRRAVAAVVEPVSTTTSIQSSKRLEKYAWWKRPSVIIGIALVVAYLVLGFVFRPTPGDEEQDDEYSKEPEYIPTTLEDSEYDYNALQPGELLPFVWKDSNIQADQYGRFLGLPPQLTERITDYVKEKGLMDLFWKLTYEEHQDHGTSVLYGDWISTRPEYNAHWKNSDMHWIDVANERAYEETLQLLREGDFDTVLQAIGREYGSQGLYMGGLGFIIASHVPAGGMHQDMPRAKRGDMFDLLFPILVPDLPDVAYLKVGNDTHHSALPFTKDVGFLLAGNTNHGTGSCDFRERRGLRVAATIYLVDLTEKNARAVAEDGTALFPVPGDTKWLWTQRGRSFNRTDPSVSLQSDKGRRPFSVQDRDEQCTQWAAEGYCESDLRFDGRRMKCLKSCGVFIDDEEYYSSKWFPKDT